MTENKLANRAPVPTHPQVARCRRKTPARLLMLLFASLGLSVACGGDDGAGSDAAQARDAAAADAAAADAASADAASADASAADAAAADAQPPDAMPPAVTVTVYVSGVVAPSIGVMIHDTDGSYLRTVMTDGSGVAEITSFPAGGAVTVPVGAFANSSASGQLTSILDVQPGDALTVGNSAGASLRDNDGTVSISYPSGSAIGATRYWSYGGCGFLSGNSGLKIDQDCVASDTVDVVTYAQNSSNSIVGWAAATGIDVTGTSPNLAGSVSHSAWSTDPLTGHGIQLTAPAQDIDAAISGTYLRGNSPFRGAAYSGAISADAANGTTVVYPDGFPDRVRAYVRMRPSGVSELEVNATTVISPVSTAAMSVDTSFSGATDLPDLPAGLSTAGEPLAFTFTPPVWRCFGNDTAADGVLISVTGRLPEDLDGGPQTQVQWRLLGKSDLASGWTLPALDPSFTDSLWPLTSFISRTSALEYISSTDFAWDDLRADVNGFSRATAENSPAVGYAYCETSQTHLTP